MLSTSVLSLLLALPGVHAGVVSVDALSAGDLVITEIMQNPDAVNDARGEWFEIYNATPYTVSLEGLYVYDSSTSGAAGEVHHPIELPPGRYLVFARTLNYTSNGGVPAKARIPAGLFLDDGSDDLILANSHGIIDEVAWDDGVTFPDPEGASMSLDPETLDATLNDDGANWHTSISTYGEGDLGTPMAENDAWGLVSLESLAADTVSTSNSGRLDVGDVNNDGYPDIAMAHGYRTAGVYLNEGDGTFAAEQVYDESWWDVADDDGATNIHLADMDGDGNLDMIVPLYGDCYSQHMVQIYQGNGDGTFDYWPTDNFDTSTWNEGQDDVEDGIVLTKGANPMYAHAADMDGDGLMDLVTGSNNGSHTTDVLVQDATGDFTLLDSENNGSNPQYLDVGDFDEDGWPDVLTGVLYNASTVYLNDGTGNLNLNGDYFGAHQQLVEIADFDGDGHEDFAARANSSDYVDVAYGDGTGSFPSTATFYTSGSDGWLQAGDLDGDGHTDLVVASDSTCTLDVLLNDGTGDLSERVSYELDAAPWGVAVEDFDQDGDEDVALWLDDDSLMILDNTGSW